MFTLYIKKEEKHLAELTPMMRQYMEIKKEYPDTLLFFRLGDFYEMFFEDAKIASKELELVLTGRDCGQEERAPMCGVPFHSVDNYLARLVAKGYKVAICEQMEDPALAKGIVKRDVSRVLTPGTVIESNMLDESKNNFLASVCIKGTSAGVVFADISTGEIHVTGFESKNILTSVINELCKFSPSEVILNGEAKNLQGLSKYIKNSLSSTEEVPGDEYFEIENCGEIISHRLNKNLQELEFANETEAVCAFGACIRYLSELQKSDIKNITKIDWYKEESFMFLNASSRNNLELTETMRRNDKKGTLLWVIDKTKCSMGKRMLRRWLENPLTNLASIVRRNRAVEELFDNPVLLSEIRESLDGIYDFERIMARVIYGTANAKELRSLGLACTCLPEIKNLLSSCKSEQLRSVYENTDTLSDVHQLLLTAIVDEPPFTVREGGMIREGYNEELDSLRLIETDSVGFINEIAMREQEKTGIKKLKIGYNRVFGYYIEVPNSFKADVPEEYIRKQTLSNCERYITQELKDLETKILGAKEKIVRIEYELFSKIREAVANEYARISKTAENIACLDALCSLAHVAKARNYCCPEISTDGVIDIEDGRHPVVEVVLGSQPFVPNNTYLDSENNRCNIITGPNMAGKSTYMRQVALITLLAQIGSFVPAKKAKISICDAIFTRVGASDDLAAGQSTFMVEMNEVSQILKQATSKSLIIFDEIGRGTSTFDGMSIARAVLEYTADKKTLGAKTLFATHYHELTELEGSVKGIINYNIAVKKRGDDITFLRRIIRGGADGSYGIEVAKLAGVPDSVVKRARKILEQLEILNGKDPEHKNIATLTHDVPKYVASEQVSFGFNSSNELLEEIKTIDVNTLTPIEAMSKLYEIVNKAKEI